MTSYNDMLSAHQPFETYPEQIREIARELGADGSEISADDVRRVLAVRFPLEFGPDVAIPRRNWMGSCFAGEEWECKGWTRSKAKGAHMNPIRLWALKGRNQ